MACRHIMTAMASVVAAVAIPTAAPVHAAPQPARPPDAPRYIDHTEWEYHGDRATLRVFPTYGGWLAAGVLSNGNQNYDAWAELLENAPEANTLTMQNQFFCYWQLASFTNPAKIGSWNLEPWRPIVSNTILLNSGCNPGGPDDVLNW